MKPTMEILAQINTNSSKNKNEIFTRLYRYLLRPDIYYVAYKNLYSNNGAGTKGIDNDTADGFSEDYVAKIIEKLKTEEYQPTPVRRIYIEKKNSDKLRPLGIPSFSLCTAVFPPTMYSDVKCLNHLHQSTIWSVFRDSGTMIRATFRCSTRSSAAYLSPCVIRMATFKAYR